MRSVFRKGDVNLPSGALFWTVIIAVTILVIWMLVRNWGGTSSGLIDKVPGFGPVILLLPRRLFSLRR